MEFGNRGVGTTRGRVAQYRISDVACERGRRGANNLGSHNKDKPNKCTDDGSIEPVRASLRRSILPTVEDRDDVDGDVVVRVDDDVG